ncbi:MAG TPA: ABC transporter permease [Planctomycetaceae bacterium]|nr:ABC transporter permease [Planctomycetaceae bacterium]
MGAWEITKKDLRLIIKDKGALYTLLALPVVFIAILGVSTGELITTHESSKLLKVGVLDEDGSPLAQQVFHDLSHIGGLSVGTVPDRDQANFYLQDGRCSVVVFLGKDFHNVVEDLDPADVVDIEHGRLAQGLSALDVHVECAAEFAQVAELVEYVVLSAVLRVIAPEVLKRNRLISTLLNRMIQKHQDALQTGQVGPEPIKPRGNIIYQTLVPAFMVMFAFFLVNIMASSFINERRLGTLRRLQMSQISPEQLLWGKTLPFLIVSIAQCVLLFLSGKFMFGMSWGTYPAMLIPVLLTTSFSATGLGLLLATIVRTESQVTSYSTFLVIVLAGISGCYMPREWLPELMKTISLGTPHAWALIAYDELLTRAHPNFGLVLRCCGVLTAMGSACFAAGCLRFRKLEYPVS